MPDQDENYLSRKNALNDNKNNSPDLRTSAYLLHTLIPSVVNASAYHLRTFSHLIDNLGS